MFSCGRAKTIQKRNLKDANFSENGGKKQIRFQIKRDTCGRGQRSQQNGRVRHQALGSSGRKRERARARETREPIFSCAHYFQAPATQASRI